MIGISGAGRSAEEHDAKQERETYLATDNDLPEVSWREKHASGA
jgi:hypothetical protein